MNAFQNYLSKHKFAFHCLAFGLMIVPAAFMYTSAENGVTGLSYSLLGLVIIGNLLILMIQ